MRIAYITHEYPPDTGFGGIGTYTTEIAQAMKSLGHDVEVFSASYDRNVSEDYLKILTHRVQVNEISEFRTSVLAVFSDQHRSKPFDLVECPEIGGEASLIKEKYPDFPSVVRLHAPSVLITRLQNTYVSLGKKLRFITGNLLRGRIDLGYWSRHDKNQYCDPDYLITEKASLITAPSAIMKNWAVKFWRIEPERIKVVPNSFHCDSACEYKMPQYNYITFLGRLNVLKGIVSFTKAIPMILQKNPSWQIRIIGKDEESPVNDLSMKEWMSKKLEKYLKQIEFIDWVLGEEKQRYLAESEIVVVPSLFESFSYVCVEAMSLGKVVVGSKQTAMKEILGARAGVLVNAKSPRSIGNAINKIISNPEKRMEIGKLAKEKVEQEYAPSIVAAQMVKVFKNAIEK